MENARHGECEKLEKAMVQRLLTSGDMSYLVCSRHYNHPRASCCRHFFAFLFLLSRIVLSLMISLVWLVELEVRVPPGLSPFAKRAPWLVARSGRCGRPRSAGWVGWSEKSTLSPCGCWGGFGNGPKACRGRPLAPSQRVPSPRATSLACGPPFFMPCAPISCVRSARQMCAQKQAFANWLNGDFLLSLVSHCLTSQ